MYRLKRVENSRVNLDLTVGYVFVLCILAYILMYGKFRTKGFHLGAFGYGYLAIIIPIWIIDGLKSTFESLLPRAYKDSKEDLSKVGVIIACKDGEGVLSSTLNNLGRRFKPEQIMVASNGSTDMTCMIARELGVRCLNIKEPVGKVRAINRALKMMPQPYILLIDDDTYIDDAIIPTGLLDDGYDAVAFRLEVKHSNWVTQFQKYEYRKSSDIGKCIHNSKASVQSISGAIGLFTRSILLQQTSRHTGEFSGEDLQRTLLIHLTAHRHGVVLSNSVVTTVAPTTVMELFKQRVFGWYPGLYANVKNYLKIMTRDHMPWALRIDAFYNCFFVVFLDLVRLLAIPIIVFYPWYFVVMYLVYVVLETISYLKIGHKDPYWVVLLYPLYGLFGFFTRISALAVFIYRRLVVILDRLPQHDDYRKGKKLMKAAAILATLTMLCGLLLLNIIYNYGHYVVNLPH